MAHFSSLSAFIALMLLAIVAGCDSPSGPATGALPSGRWYLDTTAADGETRRSSSFFFDGSSTVRLADTLRITDGSGGWRVDSTRFTLLTLGSTPEGYFRGMERQVVGSDTLAPTLRYWYFFVRNDSLRYYRGMRFGGEGTGLPGTWRIAAEDTALAGGGGELTFGSGAVEIKGSHPALLPVGTFPTIVEGSRLRLVGRGPIGFGERYEVVPGIALYLTGDAEGGHRALK